MERSTDSSIYYQSATESDSSHPPRLSSSGKTNHTARVPDPLRLSCSRLVTKPTASKPLGISSFPTILNTVYSSLPSFVRKISSMVRGWRMFYKSSARCCMPTRIFRSSAWALLHQNIAISHPPPTLKIIPWYSTTSKISRN